MPNSSTATAPVRATAATVDHSPMDAQVYSNPTSAVKPVSSAVSPMGKPLVLNITPEQQQQARKVAARRQAGHDHTRTKEQDLGAAGNWNADYYGALGEILVRDALNQAGYALTAPALVEDYAPQEGDFVLNGSRFDVKACPPPKEASKPPYVYINSRQHDAGKCDYYLPVVFESDHVARIPAPLPHNVVSHWQKGKAHSEFYSCPVAALKPLRGWNELAEAGRQTPRSSLLSEGHRALLHESGLSDATIAARGYKTAMFKNALTECGFSTGQARNLPALLIPIYDGNGNLALWQMRPDEAPIFNGKPCKYMTPAGTKLCLDVPHSVQPRLADVSVPLWITEGSKKVDAAVQHGLCCIGALGVTGWTHHGGEPLPDWEQIALKNRVVNLAFDADVTRKIEVWRALQALKTFLTGRGATVQIAYLPDDAADPTKKIGLDDYLKTHAPASLNALLSLDLCPAPRTNDDKPRTELERLRKDGLTRKLQGVADVHPHGGIKYSKDATEAEIRKAAKALNFFYGRIDDLKKWDMLDTWMAVVDKLDWRDRATWKTEHFGRFAPQVGNWKSKVGERFARNADNSPYAGALMPLISCSSRYALARAAL